MKNVLLISPTISDIYKDIIEQLQLWGMHVDFIVDKGDPNDPDFIRVTKSKFVNNKVGRARYEKRNLLKWKELLSSKEYNKIYDYLLVIDGMSVHPYLFEELRRRNSNLWAANYLFDSCISLYRFNNRFQYFDKVASFDKNDCKAFNLSFLPIYWKELPTQEKKYDIFALGGFGRKRYNLFKEIATLSDRLGFISYIKLYTPQVANYKAFVLKSRIKQFIGYNKKSITPEEYKSSLITHEGIPASDFQKIISQSDCIIDTLNYEQDGMTARFMWALGAGKKIITDNINFLGYDCYNPKQVLVLDERTMSKDIVSFLKEPFSAPDKESIGIMEWRLDYWLKSLLNINE